MTLKFLSDYLKMTLKFLSNYRILLICGSIQLLMVFLISNDVKLLYTNLLSFLLKEYIAYLFLLPILFLALMYVFIQKLHSSPSRWYRLKMGLFYCNSIYCVVTLLYVIVLSFFIFKTQDFAGLLLTTLEKYPDFPLHQNPLNHKYTELVSLIIREPVENLWQRDPMFGLGVLNYTIDYPDNKNCLKLSILPNLLLDEYLQSVFRESPSNLLLLQKIKFFVIELNIKK